MSQSIIGYRFKERYQIKRKIKEGGFASVYIAKDLKDQNKLVAVKVMLPKSKFYAEVEFKMYEKIKQKKFTLGFVKHFDQGLQNNKYFIIMQRLGQDLDELMMLMKNKSFSLKTVLMIGLQVIDRLEAFHKIGYLHRDIKPDNLVIGLQQKNKIIYLIDFGLAKKIQESRPNQKGKLLGSLAYMSCRAHQGKPTGPADDIESLLYTMLHLLAGSLPWVKLKIKTLAQTHKILIMKKKISKIDFKNINIPSKFFEILEKIKSTQIKEKLDYLEIKYKMLEMLKMIKSENDFYFDWLNMKLFSLQKRQKSEVSGQKMERQRQKQENQKQIQRQIYQVYKFLDRSYSDFSLKKNISNRNSKKKSKQKQSRRKITPIQRLDIKKQSEQKEDKKYDKEKEHKTKNRPSSVINKKQQKLSSAKLKQIFDNTKYEGPNITINKVPKHKI